VSSFIVLLDACVLAQRAVCDTLLRAAEADLYRVQWGPDILMEVERTVQRPTARAGRSDAEQKAQRLIAELRAAFPEAHVSGYADVLSAMRNDEKDRHVLAAAVVGRAQAIIAWNTRHFPAVARDPYGSRC